MHPLLRNAALAALCAALLATAAYGRSDRQTARAADPVVLVGAGDIAACDQDNDEATAKLLDQIPGAVFTLGDNVYTAGTLAEFTACYDPTWGRHKARTRPAAGNHDYITPGGTGYHTYFGEAAGPLGKGYYSYTLGAWKIIVLNANCGQDPTVPVTPDPDFPGNPCGPGSPQLTWLEQELATSPDCTAAMIHYPLVTSGIKPDYPHVKPMWDLLYAYSADVVMSGDDHIYERFAKITPENAADPARGIRLFIIGTGGNQSYAITAPAPNSEVRRGNDPVLGPNFGVMKFTLAEASYSWQFIPVAGQSFTDSGTDTCSRGFAPEAAIHTQPDPPTVTEGGTVTFDGSPSTDDRTPDSELDYDWDLDGDGTFDASGQVVTHTYDDPGSYQALLRITDADGATSTATVRVTVTPFCETAAFSDDLEPSPEPGWQVDTAVNDNPGSAAWQVIPDPGAHSATQSWFTDGTTQAGKDDRLVAPAVDLGPASQLSFWHRFRLETGFDGGVLEVSRDGGATWADVTTSGSFIEGGYNGSVSSANPAGGRPAWTGGSDDAAAAPMTRVVADLGGFAGEDVLLRWRLGTDLLSAEPGQGWWIDDVEITGIPLPCNRPPVAVDDAASTTEEEPVTVAVLANDSDPEGDALTVTDVTAPANGAAAANPDGTVTYTPDPGFVGTDEFKYTISDGTSTSSARVTVTVAPRPNADPVANDDAATTRKNKAVRIAVLANDSDPDGDTLVVGAVSGAAHGTVTVNADSTVTYRPDNGYSGPDSFTYTAADGQGGRDTATVSIVVKRL